MVKNFFYTVLLLGLFIPVNTCIAQEAPEYNDWIRNFPGIPIKAPLQKWEWITNHPDAVDSMRQAGVDIVHWSVDNINQMTTLSNWDSSGFQVMPRRSLDYNWIQHYTDAKYSVWEAEGNDTYDANLERDIANTEIDISGSYIKLKGDIQNSVDTLIKGPYYRQDLTYYASQDGGCDTVRYRAEFRLMLQENNPPVAYNPDDTICVLQVTQSYAIYPTILGCTYVIKERTLTRGDFTALNQFYDFLMHENPSPDSTDYKLTSDSCQTVLPGQPEEQHTFLSPPPCSFDRVDRAYIQYKVIWKGKSNSQGKPGYLLSVDKVTVSDDRGRELINTPIGETNILLQANSLNAYTENISGWLGIDEPTSIDIFEPIRLVTEILENNSQGERPLWLAFMSRWDGVWDHHNNIFGAMGLSPWAEFKKRVGKGNIIQNFYLFDFPYCNTCRTDWYSENIRVAGELNYKQAYELDPYFGADLQTGEVHNTVAPAEQRNIDSHEFLYTANLALMYGAKFLSLISYFAQTDTGNCQSGSHCRAIVDYDANDNLIYTDKYYMLRDTLNPRLKGLFGKTLKGLIPVADSLGKNTSVTYDVLNFNHLHKVTLDREGQGSEAMNSFVDIGSFNKPGENGDNYFMVINRWYSEPLLYKFKLELNYLSDYNNWNLKNYVDSSEVTILPDGSSEATSPTDTIVVGDAILYSLKPVVLYGGKLIVDEPAGEGQILKGDMTIDNGATLSIAGDYYAQGDIIIKNGNIEKYNDPYTSGTIHFQNGHKLIIEGAATINGTSSDKLTLDFGSSVEGNGVVIKSGGSLVISYCNIQNSANGITAELNTSFLSAQYIDFSNCDSIAITILGQSGNGPQTPQPPEIKYCTITGSEYGIEVTNLPEILIQENYITNTSYGIYLSNVTNAIVAGNNLSSNLYNSPGILAVSTGGVIRTNSISGFTNGIHFGNCNSIDVGGNDITDCKYHGIYVGLGSIINMAARLVQNQGTHQWYAVSGYNRIYENGGYDGQGEQIDGSEIYFNNSNAIMKGERDVPGCNSIYDDRQASPPVVNTLLLMNGLSNGIQHININAEDNYWGTTTPTSQRFGDLVVDFDPYYTTECQLPVQGDALVMMTSTGEVIDTLYPSGQATGQLSQTDLLYAQANKLFLTGDIESSESYYDQVVSSDTTLPVKKEAFSRKYEIGKLLGRGEEYFDDLRNIYLSLVQSTSDLLQIKIFNQLSTLCLSAKTDYIPAIGEFDQIVQQNPNTEEAAYAEIDALTTSLLVEGNDSSLHKGPSGKYLVKGKNDYHNRLNQIMRKHFGSGNTETEKEIIPTEYTLYQNYPNPFNPITTIKYDLPNTGEISVIIYDILGRKVKELVNTKQLAGRYEVKWDALRVASGVYLYQLRTNDYVNTKKMILLK